MSPVMSPLTPPARIRSLDLLRGIAMMLVVFFHSAIYNFANIHKIDFDNPPVLIVLMSFMALWGGIFIIYSMTVNAYILAHRVEGGAGTKAVRHLALACAAYLVLHFPLNLLLGRWNVDFVNNQPDMTLMAHVLRGVDRAFSVGSHLFEGSSLSTVALNLVVTSCLLYWLLRGGWGQGRSRAARSYWFLGVLGLGVMVLSFARVEWYGLLVEAREEGNHLLSIAYSFVLANPYPLVPYLAYGLFGAMIGLMIHDRRADLLKRVILPLGIAFVLFGLFGMTKFDKTISKPDFFWYFKTNFELGLFLLLVPGAYLILEVRERGRRLAARLTVPALFSRVCLTVYLLETTMSELMRKIATPLFPGWDQTIGGCLVFGACNVAVWAGLLWLWRRQDFRYSLEDLWVRWFRRAGKESTKLAGLPSGSNR